MQLVTAAAGLDQLIAALRSSGRLVIGPTHRDGVITHDEIFSTADLPRGWTDSQTNGSYRLHQSQRDEFFGYSAPSESWKRYVLPPRTLLIRGRRTNDGIQIEEPRRESTPVAFFGIRPCDLAGLQILDRVLHDSDMPDPDYVARRDNAFIVAVGCSRPSSTCFCASMETGPAPSSGFDIAITELHAGTPSTYLIESATDAGHEMLAAVDGRPVADTDRSVAAHQYDDAVTMMTREIVPDDLALAAVDPENPRWAAVADECLACGNCTMSCPTCFCSTTDDAISLDGNETERSRVWDSCFTLDFTYLDGGAVRSSISSRYRQWFLHKLVTWHDQFESSGCVGCGRCITWCPAGIDLTAEVAALAQSQRAQTATVSS